LARPGRGGNSGEREDAQMEHIIGRLLHDYEHGKLTRRQ
jgi:hypothetical protein